MSLWYLSANVTSAYFPVNVGWSVSEAHLAPGKAPQLPLWDIIHRTLLLKQRLCPSSLRGAVNFLYRLFLFRNDDSKAIVISPSILKYYLVINSMIWNKKFWKLCNVDKLHWLQNVTRFESDFITLELTLQLALPRSPRR